MRILIVDDNVALQETLTEVISNAGHETDVVTSIKTAISSMSTFNPDLIILDTDMEGGNGLLLIDMMQENDPSIDKKVIVLRSWNRQIPQDSALIKGCIQKPFSSTDILNGIEKATSEGEPEEKPIQSDAVEAVEHKGVTITQKGLNFGESYILFENNPSKVYTLVSIFDREGYDVLLVTPNKNKTIKERFKNNNVQTHHMTLKLIGGHLNIYRLGTMIDDVRSFIESKDRPVVVFDDLDKFIERNGLNSVLTAVHQVVSDNYSKEATFLASVNAKEFTKKDKDILLNHMKIYDQSGDST